MRELADLQILAEKAELLKSIAHPIRLCIIRGLLETGESNVSKIQCCLNIPQSTLSQHLAKLRAIGIIRGKREGTEIYYHVVNEDIKRVVATLLELGNI